MKEYHFQIPEKLKALLEPHRYKVLYGGRGGSKSVSVAIFLILKSMEKKVRILCTREIQRSLKDSSHKMIADIIYSNDLGKYFDITREAIRCKRNGSEFIFAGLAQNTVDSIKSYSNIDFCWVEEAQSVSEHSLEILIPTIRGDESEIIFTFNPYTVEDPVYKRFVLNGRSLKDCVLIPINYYDNPWCPQVLIDEAIYLKENDFEAYSNIWEGLPKKYSEAIIFKDKFKVSYFEPNESLWDGPYYGCDWGFSDDPTAIIKCWIYGDILYIEDEAYEKHVEIDMLAPFFDKLPKIRNYVIKADSARPELISHMKRNGFRRMISVKKWNGSIEDGIDYIRSFHEIIIHPKCTNTLEEFRQYSYKMDRKTNEILPIVIDKYNHLIDSLRYALEPLILGQKKEIKSREENTYKPSFESDISMTRFFNKDLWIS